MYRNIYYDYKKSIIHIWTWDENGQRTKLEVDFEPYLYIEDVKSNDATSIFNTKLKKLKFESNFKRKSYLEATSNHRIFYNLNPDQQFLLDTFKNEVLNPDFSINPLRIYYLDIETYKKNEKDAFSTAEEAKDIINVITIYDSLEQRYHVWGINSYSTTDEDVFYTKCKDEKQLLSEFLKFWRKNTPDIVSGWNFHGYDLPYIMNRLTILFDEDKNKKISPLERVFYRENVSVNALGQKKNQWFIATLVALIFVFNGIVVLRIYARVFLGSQEKSHNHPSHLTTL
jgi:DNA polymerase elongation subunit (family B)